MTLVARFTTMTVALVVLTATAVGVLTYREVEAAILPAELARLQENVHRLTVTFDEAVAAVRNDVAGFASAAALAGIVRARLAGGIDPEGGVAEAVWRERLARRWLGELQVKSAYAQFGLIGAADDGREVVRVDRAGAAGAARVVPDGELQARGSQGFFKQAIQMDAREVYVSSIDLHQEQGRIAVPQVPTLRVAAPVFTATGERFGLLVINLDLRPLFAALKQRGHRAGTIRIVNDEGDFLVHPDAAREFGFERASRHRVQDEFPMLAEFLRQADHGTHVLDLPGGPAVGLAFARIRPAGGPAVVLIETVPRAAMLAAASLVRQSSLTVGVAAAACAALLAVWLARGLAAPLAQLTDGVNAFAAGRPLRMPQNLSGELGVLARTFTRMVDAVGAQAGALRESEARYRGTLDRMMEGCEIIGRDWRYLYVNPVAAQHARRPAAELLGRTMMECRPGIETTAVFAAIKRCMDGGPAEHMDHVLAHADGSAGVFQLGIQAVPEGVFILSLDVTARHQAEAALRQSREEFKDLFENAPIGYHEIDAQGRIVRINTAELEMLGYRADELLGEEVWMISADPELSRRAALEKLAGHAPPAAFERRFRRKDGSTFPVLIDDRLIRRADGTVSGIRAVVQDITERKRAETALRASDARLHAVTENLTEGLIIASVDGELLHWNRAGLELCGYRDLAEALRQLTEFVDTFVHATLDGQVLEFAQWPLSRVLRGEVLRDVELRVRRRDMDWERVVSYSGTIVHDASGRPLAFLSLSDITARKQAEAAVRESEEYFRFLNDLTEATRALADAAQIMVVMARMLGTHVGASRCAYADVDDDGEMFTILHDYTDGCPSTVGRYRLSLFGARAVATLRRGETLILRDVGAELPPGDGADMFHAIGINAVIVCPLVKEGTLRAMMAVHQTTPRDWQPREVAIVQTVVERCWATIERRNAVENVRRLNVELEQRVLQRTAQLEAANRELEAFSYSVSHDLRAPLRTLDGFSQAVLEDFGPQLPADGQRYLQTIRSGAQRMGELIDDLLTFSRLSRQPLKRSPVDMGALVARVLEEEAPHWSGRTIDWRIGALPAGTGDPALLKQVWVNLLSNAVKYTSRREQAVIEVGCDGAADRTVYFVRDNGTGFDMQYVGKLFGVFQRLHRAEDFPGTGVGLAIVQRIVHRHGGRIWAEAAVDRGATFFFTLQGEATHE